MRVLVLADIHANLTALDAVLASAPPYDTIWNLGDTVGYGPEPVAVLDRLASLDVAVTLSGNHDLAAAGALPLDAFNTAAATAARWTRLQLSDEQRVALVCAPVSVELDDVTLAHGSPRDPIWEYVTSALIARAALEAAGGSICLVGHSHLPLIGYQHSPGGPVNLAVAEPGTTVSLASGRWLLNPGSVGQPRDGDPRAAATLLDLSARTATWLRVTYDVAATQAAMRSAALPISLIDRLAYGQ